MSRKWPFRINGLRGKLDKLDRTSTGHVQFVSPKIALVFMIGSFWHVEGDFAGEVGAWGEVESSPLSRSYPEVPLRSSPTPVAAGENAALPWSVHMHEFSRVLVCLENRQRATVRFGNGGLTGDVGDPASPEVDDERVEIPRVGIDPHDLPSLKVHDRTPFLLLVRQYGPGSRITLLASTVPRGKCANIAT